MKLTKEQIIAACDEVMGIDMTCIECKQSWCNDASPYECPHCGNCDSYQMLGLYQCDPNYNPMAKGNDHQAMELLIKSPYRWFIMDPNDDGEYRVSVRKSNEMKWEDTASGMMHDANLLAFVMHPHLPTAIVLAVLSAVKGEAVTIKEQD